MLMKSEAVSNRKRDEELNDAKKLVKKCAEDLEVFKKWTINDGALSGTEKSANKGKARLKNAVNNTINFKAPPPPPPSQPQFVSFFAFYNFFTKLLFKDQGIRAVALYDCEADEEDELSFTKGETITQIEMIDDEEVQYLLVWASCLEKTG